MIRSLFILVFLCTVLEVLAQNSISYSDWSIVAPLPSGKVDDGSGFTLKCRLYYGCGMNESFRLRNEWNCYDIAKAKWIQMDTLPGEARQYASSFSSNSYGFVVGGILPDNRFSNECFLFDPSAMQWMKLDNAPWQPRGVAAVFTVGNYAFLAGGRNDSVHFNDMWRFNLETHHWDLIGDIPGDGKDEMSSFGIKGSGYLMLGREKNGCTNNQVWKYDLLNDSWSRMSDFPGKARTYSAVASSNSGALIIGGENGDGELLSECYFYNPDEDNWLHLPNYRIELRGAELLNVEDDFYVLCGLTQSNTGLNEVERITITKHRFYNSSPFEVYPNPNRGEFAIKSTLDYEFRMVTVHDARGKFVERITGFASSNFSTLDLRDEEKGVYIVTIASEAFTQRLKILIY